MRRFMGITLALLLCGAAVAAESNVETVIASKQKGEPLDTPFGVAFDGRDSLYIQEFDGHRTLKLVDGKPVLVAGGGGIKGYKGDGGAAKDAVFNGPHNLAAAADGTLYIADTWNHVVRRVDGKTGVITTIAGTGEKGFGGDGGPATEAKFNGTYCVTLNHTFDRLYVADLGNRRIRVVDLKAGTVDTVAGNGNKGVPDDGAIAKENPLVDPRAVAPDSLGNVYILERGGHALRVVSTDGTIKTVAGGSGKKGKADGDVTTCTLNGPKHLCVDGRNRVIIADAENNLIRLYDPKTGLLTTLPIEGLARPHGVAVGPDGLLYIADSYNHRVLRTTLPK